MKLSSLKIKSLVSVAKFALTIPVALLLRHRHKNMWIITERSTQARDNGYCYFKYLRTTQPQRDVWYIIDKKADDYKKIAQYGNVIAFDSLRHYLYYSVSKVHISAHIRGCYPSSSPVCARLKKPLKIKDVFIPHGVSYGVSEFCLKKYARQDLFICSNVLEYENVLANYGYSKEEVAYTGYPRLDYWHGSDTDKKQIVLMPTWRAYLAQNPDTVFEKTDYYRAYLNLIQSPELSEFLINNNLNLVFYLHHEMRKYVDSFATDCPNIEIVTNDDKYDIQNLLRSSALLITDYSSVHFDFAYMGKPVIYYQFDKAEFFDRQYKHSAFDAEINGFGPVCYNSDEVVNSLEKMYDNSFEMEEKYYSRMRDIYKLCDKDNCKRVTEAIDALLTK